jgi:hypothetical protein
MGWATFWAIFFINSSGHPAHRQYRGTYEWSNARSTFEFGSSNLIYKVLQFYQKDQLYGQVHPAYFVAMKSKETL